MSRPDRKTYVSDTSADLMLGLNAFILLTILLLIPQISQIARQEAYQEEAITTVQTLQSQEFSDGQAKVDPFFLSHSGVIFGKDERQQTSLERLYDDQDLANEIKRHLNEQKPLNLLIDTSALETAFLFETLLASLGVQSTYRFYAGLGCDFSHVAAEVSDCRLHALIQGNGGSGRVSL